MRFYKPENYSPAMKSDVLTAMKVKFGGQKPYLAVCCHGCAHHDSEGEEQSQPRSCSACKVQEPCRITAASQRGELSQLKGELPLMRGSEELPTQGSAGAHRHCPLGWDMQPGGSCQPSTNTEFRPPVSALCTHFLSHDWIFLLQLFLSMK